MLLCVFVLFLLKSYLLRNVVTLHVIRRLIFVLILGILYRNEFLHTMFRSRCPSKVRSIVETRKTKKIATSSEREIK